MTRDKAYFRRASNRSNNKFRARYGVSRQRLWQIRKREQGKCERCGRAHQTRNHRGTK